MFNATEYEFDVNVYSPIGTVVFEVLLLVENPNNMLLLLVDLVGMIVNIFSFNGMGNFVEFFGTSISENITLAITLDETLNPDDRNVTYQFSLSTIALDRNGSAVVSEATVLLYQWGKICIYTN